MQIYLDESGDTGFKFHRGSSRYFVVALLMVDDPLPLHEAIRDLRARLTWPETREFKFVHTHPEARVTFFRAIRRYPFLIHALVVDKSRLHEPELRKKEAFYGKLVTLALQESMDDIADALLIMDESFKGKGSKMNLTTHLRQTINVANNETPRTIKDVRYHQSHRDNLLQIIDMVAGAVARAYEGGDDQYLRLLRPRLTGVTLYPSQTHSGPLS